MGKLIYTGLISLDGCLVDPEGNFDWAAPDPEVHAAVNEQERPVGTYLYGRRMYEVMRYWETEPGAADASPAELEYADLWRKADKVVFSSTLDQVTTARTRVERRFDVDHVRELKRSSEPDLSIGGAGLAASALRCGLVDELAMYVSPVVVGGGTRFLPDGVRLDLELLQERRFTGGVVLLRYAVQPPRSA
ncbi:dihydrofolate reductase family protein [Lysobacter korlensis]|uniref:Dihydrofolate reductase family protein n=1 Tax=Lysobacter korlensis TaxID=553636 RepID=A0ABV6S0C6_9GAMM